MKLNTDLNTMKTENSTGGGNKPSIVAPRNCDNSKPPVDSQPTDHIVKGKMVFHKGAMHGVVSAGGTIAMKDGNTQLFIRVTPINDIYNEVVICESQMGGYTPSSRYVRPKIIKKIIKPKKEKAKKIELKSAEIKKEEVY